jgi:hypothetical protein
MKIGAHQNAAFRRKKREKRLGKGKNRLKKTEKK